MIERITACLFLMAVGALATAADKPYKFEADEPAAKPAEKVPESSPKESPKVSPKPLVPPPDPKISGQKSGQNVRVDPPVAIEGAITRPFMMPDDVLITGPDPCEACGYAGRQLARYVKVRFDKTSENAKAWTARFGGPVFHFKLPNGLMDYLTSEAWDIRDETKILRAIDHRMRRALPHVEFDNQAELRVAAKPIRAPFRAQVTQAFAVLKQAKVGAFSLKWHADKERKIRVAGRNKTELDWISVLGNSGHVDFEAPGSELPDGKLGFGYRIFGDWDYEIDLDPVHFRRKGMAATASASEQKCGVEPLTIISAIIGLMNLLNSNAEIALPTDIWTAAKFTDHIEGEFTRGNPQLLVKHAWSTESKATKYNVTTALAHLDLKGWDWLSGWFLPRQFNLAFD